MAESKKETGGAMQSFGIKRGGGSDRFAQVEHARNIKGTTARLIGYFAGERGLLAALAAAVVFGTVGGVIAPSFQSNAVDIMAGERSGSFALTVGLMLALYILYSAAQFFQDILCAHMSQRIVKRLRNELFSKLMDMPVKYLDTHSHGDVMSRMTNDVENISATVSQALPSLFSGVLMMVGTVVMMLRYCWQLTVLSILTVSMTAVITKILGGKVRKYSKSRQALLGELNGGVEETVSVIRTVTAYNRQNICVQEFISTSDRLTRAGIMLNSLGGIFGPLMNAVGNLSFVVVAAFGGWFAIHGVISVGVISAFIVYAKQFARPLNQLASIYNQIQMALAGAERVFALLDEAAEDLSGEPLVSSKGAEVVFDHVDFSYVPGVSILRDFCLRVPPGKCVALVGSTGSGKTTVANLLLRYYDVDGGTVAINGQDIRSVSREDLRRRAAIVLQDTSLFTDTVRSNLKYSARDATDREMESAAQMSRCLDFIRAMPQGFDTVLTGAGANLSQGQRQLLAIARAFIADPDILILDEATSNVDTRTEKAIQDAMRLVMRDRTSIIIAHRLSTIRDADIIVVMDAGTVVESGSHRELLEKRGKYYELYMTQYAGFNT